LTVQLTESIAYLVADVSLRNGLARANAIAYTTAKSWEVEVVTGDVDLKYPPEVVFVMHLSMKVGLTQVDQRGS
jgi:hypothetical protein